uniref:Uncharacterized protein n=1 Tax=Arundo donax TaxID=35708 RepID=A0A0A9AZX3_ARUDO
MQFSPSHSFTDTQHNYEICGRKNQRPTTHKSTTKYLQKTKGAKKGLQEHDENHTFNSN